jgi:excisionase family DNA binding protein
MHATTPTPGNPESGISTSIAAAELGCTSRTVRRLLERGLLAGYRLGPRAWRTSRAAIREFQQAGGIPDARKR